MQLGLILDLGDKADYESNEFPAIILDKLCCSSVVIGKIKMMSQTRAFSELFSKAQASFHCSAPSGNDIERPKFPIRHSDSSSVKYLFPQVFTIFHLNLVQQYDQLHF